MFLQNLIPFLIMCLGGVFVIFLVLYKMYGKGITLKLWVALTPGILLTVTIAFFSGKYNDLSKMEGILNFLPFLAGGVLMLVLSFVYLGNTIGKKISEGVKRINESAQHMSSASSQYASSSQSLAQSSSEQASSLEEISASLEEITAMVNQNAEQSKQAYDKTLHIKGSADQGNIQVSQLSNNMSDILDSSTKTVQVVKTIDDIAFQTNLLALNAAVEAARAGESGKGFAVVAEEVRSLAQRCAEAAKETGELIGSAQKNVEEGVSVTEKVTKSLLSLGEEIQDVSGLVSEVHTAVDEVLRGVENINTAISGMNETTQNTAANAEETASSARELSELSYTLDSVGSLLREFINKHRMSADDRNRTIQDNPREFTHLRDKTQVTYSDE